jgi:hypothetical protein
MAMAIIPASITAYPYLVAPNTGIKLRIQAHSMAHPCSLSLSLSLCNAVTTVDSGRRALEILGLAGEDQLHVSSLPIAIVFSPVPSCFSPSYRICDRRFEGGACFVPLCAGRRDQSHHHRLLHARNVGLRSAQGHQSESSDLR